MLGKLIIIAIVIYPLTTYYGILGTAIAVTVPMLLEQLYLWFLIRRLTGLTIRTLLGLVALPVFVSGIMYGVIMLMKTMLPLTSIPLFALYVLVGILIYGAGIFILDKELVNEFKMLRSLKKGVVVEK